MKKLFTTILMLCVALAGWSQLSRTGWDGTTGTLTIKYEGGEIKKADLDGLVGGPAEGREGKVKKLVLEGVWANADINTDDFMKFISEKCLGNQPNQNNGKALYLDLSACNNIVSKVVYTGTGDPDYATKNFKYVYSSETEKKNVTKGDVWVEDNGNEYTGNPSSLQQEVDGNVTKYFYSQLYERGAVYNKNYTVHRDNVNGIYYHLFYDSSGGTPQQFQGPYQANSDLPDLDQDDGGYYYFSYYMKNNGQLQLVNNPQQSGYTHDETGWYNQTGNWDVENQCAYNGNLTQEGDKFYYYDYVSQRDGHTLEQSELGNLQNGNPPYSNVNKIYDANGYLIGYTYHYQKDGVSYDDQIDIIKHEVIPNHPIYLIEQKTYLEERIYTLEERKTYVENQSLWYYYENGKKIFVDEDDVTEINGNNGKVDVAKGGTSLSFNKIGQYLNGISFPNHANFTAIPDELCKSQYCPNLETVVLGNFVEWIGYRAFYHSNNKDTPENQRSKLKSVSYPGCTDTANGHVSFPTAMKAIGIDAFYGCVKFTDINLNLPNLVRLDAAAFNMVNTEMNNLTNVTLPTSSPNYTLKFWANQVFASSHITELDLENLYAIEHFAYDGYGSMGETPTGSGSITPTATFTWMTSLVTLRLPKNLVYAPGGNDQNSGMCSNCTSLVNVIFTGEPEFDGCNITNKLIIGEYCFRSLPLLSNVQFSDNLSVIYQRAFDELPSLIRIEIPASVEELQNYAFNHCANMTTVIFKDTPSSFPEGCDGPATVVRGGDGQGAFYNCQAITDVYVNRQNPKLNCENYSFDYYITWGHADPTRNLATLHFPKNRVEDYVNLNHYLTDAIVQDNGKFHDWLMEHIKQAVIPYKNGWYEFINAGPTFEEEGDGYPSIMLRTFSDYDYSYIVPDGLRAYVVTDVTKNNGNYVLTVERLRVIPAKTGVILYGHPNGKSQSGNPALTLTPVAFVPGDGLPLCRANWDDNYIKNYLEPTFDENGKAKRITPFEWDKNKTAVAWRNFAMNRYSNTRSLHTASVRPLNEEEHDYVGFFRILDGTHPTGYAYLRLTGDVDDNGNPRQTTDIEYTDALGLEIVVKEDPEFHWEYAKNDKGTFFDARTKADWNPKKWWEINSDKHVDYDWKEWTLSWGIRPTRFHTDPNYPNASKFFGEIEDADGILQIMSPADSQDGEYFTLQGIRVNNPTKGIYIHNGKKVIIK